MLDWLWKNGHQPVFVPMNTVTPDDDRIVSHMIMERAEFGREVLLIDGEIFPRDVANVYSHCQAAFVARVHGSVTALLGRCPVLMYAFDLKHGGIMEQMGLSGQVFSPETGSPKDAVEMMGEVLRSRTRLIAQMEEKARELQEQAKITRDAVLRLRDAK